MKNPNLYSHYRWIEMYQAPLDQRPLSEMVEQALWFIQRWDKVINGWVDDLYTDIGGEG